MSRSSRLAATLSLALAVPAGAALEGASESEARADEPAIDVGTELVATSDVTLHTAEIAKGSRVSVTKLSRDGGQLAAVSVALADGHVVKVTMAQVHTFFRVAE